MPVQCTCRQCGAAFNVPPSRLIYGGGVYCSRACHTAHMTGKPRPQGTWLPRQRIVCTCRVCGATFDKKPSDIRRGLGIYCSQECYRQMRGEPAREWTCERCGVVFKRHASASGSFRYCSQACYRPPRPIQPCEHCGQPYRRSWTDYFYGHRKKYCSATCRSRAKGTLEERFTVLVDRSGGPDACWIWTGYRGTDGYGRLTIGRKQYSAHRLALKFWAHVELQDRWALHTCPGGDNRACVNPKHLRPGTILENNRDWRQRGRSPLSPRRHADVSTEDSDVSG